MGGLTYRAVPGLHGWMLYLQVPALDETVELSQSLAGSVVRPKTAVPRAAWVTIVADLRKRLRRPWTVRCTQAGPMNASVLPAESTWVACCRQKMPSFGIAFDVSYTHTYAPGTRRHIKNALKAGATMEEIMEVLKLSAVQRASL